MAPKSVLEKLAIDPVTTVSGGLLGGYEGLKRSRRAESYPEHGDISSTFLAGVAPVAAYKSAKRLAFGGEALNRAEEGKKVSLLPARRPVPTHDRALWGALGGAGLGYITGIGVGKGAVAGGIGGTAIGVADNAAHRKFLRAQEIHKDKLVKEHQAAHEESLAKQAFYYGEYGTTSPYDGVYHGISAMSEAHARAERHRTARAALNASVEKARANSEKERAMFAANPEAFQAYKKKTKLLSLKDSLSHHEENLARPMPRGLVGRGAAKGAVPGAVVGSLMGGTVGGVVGGNVSGALAGAAGGGLLGAGLGAGMGALSGTSRHDEIRRGKDTSEREVKSLRRKIQDLQSTL